MKVLSLVLSIFLFSANTYAEQSHEAITPAKGCFPESLGQRPLVFGVAEQGLTKEQFDRVLDKVEAVYQPIFQQERLTLKIVRLWQDPNVNAKAKPSEGNVSERNILMFGGLARHEDTTEDSFTLVACHEIGHHLGGAPLYRNSIDVEDGQGEVFEWRASNEGQADYFATLKCARKVFERDDNVMIMQQRQVPQVVTEYCSRSFSGANEIALCQRSSLAAIALGKLLGRGTTPDLSKPDTWTVPTTQDGHPNGQCRADTYFQGSLCQVSSDLPVSRQDPDVGTCSERHGDLVGLRPRCWYAPATPALLLSDLDQSPLN